MQYDYERLTPDRFQELCQSLLVLEHDGVQCFPVGQKDGGRDSTVTYEDQKILFQIKFKRERLANTNNYAYLKRAIDGEVKHFSGLAKSGYSKYVLMTNVSGSSAPDSGVMDKTLSYLQSLLPESVSGEIWWRSDLDSRLNNAYDLKWVFSEVLTAADVFRHLLTDHFSDREVVRFLALQGYMEYQHNVDKDVKFKQANLESSSLLSLFIDVPAQFITKSNIDGGRSHYLRGGDQEDEFIFTSSLESESSASLLLGGTTAETARRVVVEGGPGQGKSTLAQYICQIQRMKLLKKRELAKIPEEHRLAPTRIPFKVDLRDLSLWLQRKNPITGDTLPADQVLSLESFLAAQVKIRSGGADFSVDDLLLLASATPFLIVLDGLDEVASHSDRKTIVESVNTTALRIQSISPRSQIVVTSRPAAVASTPKFQSDEWNYISLRSITRKLIFEYIRRWGSAKKLTKVEQSEISAVLESKLESSQIQDLAHNAMQLTILLNLVHTRGQALPDHRTELYGSYISIYFDREAAKNKVVRENRQLLIDLHGFIGWKIHAAAEARRSSGRVSQEGLIKLITEFLATRAQDDQSIKELLAGVVDRIVMIVSQIEGTFEFEVQPLREYFAGYHLYSTAPYSPSGQPQRGTKPEIFAAISQNPFWFNVARFYAGAYSVGELASLAEQLTENLSTQPASLSSFPRALTTALLNDRVFHQNPRIGRRVIDASTDALTMRYEYSNAVNRRRTNSLILAVENIEFVGDALLKRGLESPLAAIRDESAQLYWRYCRDDRGYQQWVKMKPVSPDSKIDRDLWLKFGLNSRNLPFLPKSEADDLIAQSPKSKIIFVKSAHPVVTSSAEDQLRALVYGANGTATIHWIGTPLEPIHDLLREPRLMLRMISRRGYRNGPLYRRDADYSKGLAPNLQLIYSNFKSIPDPNRGAVPEFVHEIYRAVGPAVNDSWFHWDLAIVALSQLVMTRRANHATDSLCPKSKNCQLCIVRDAYLNRSNITWWTELFAVTTSSSKYAQLALVGILTAYGSPRVLQEFIGTADTKLLAASEEELDMLLRTIRFSFTSSRPARLSLELSKDRSIHMKALLGIEAVEKASSQLAKQITDADEPISGAVASWAIWPILQDYSELEAQPSAFLSRARRLFAALPDSIVGSYAGQRPGMSVDTAKTVLSDCDSYPVDLIIIADEIVSLAGQRQTKSISSTARKGRWAANGRR